MEYLKGLYHGNKQQAEGEMEKRREPQGGDDEAEIQKKKFMDIWRNVNMLKHVAPLPVIFYFSRAALLLLWVASSGPLL